MSAETSRVRTGREASVPDGSPVCPLVFPAVTNGGWSGDARRSQPRVPAVRPSVSGGAPETRRTTDTPRGSGRDQEAPSTSTHRVRPPVTELGTAVCSPLTNNRYHHKHKRSISRNFPGIRSRGAHSERFKVDRAHESCLCEDPNL